MKKEGNKNGIIIGLLLGIIIALLVLVVLFATDTISVNSNKVNNNNKNNTVTNNEIIDSEILDDLYRIIGILPVDQDYRNDCLNQEISNNNYKENAKEIFSWYALLHQLNTYHYEESKCQSSNECKLAYSCAACSSISKNDAKEIIKLYNFGNKLDTELRDMPAYDDEYSYSSYTNQPSFCEYSIEHNTESKYINSSDIRIIDNQIVKEYNFDSDKIDENLKTTKTQTVTYDFKLDANGNYYLSSVEVK